MIPTPDRQREVVPMTQSKSDLQIVTEAMRATQSETVADLLEAFRAHGVSNATELLAKLEGDRRG